MRPPLFVWLRRLASLFLVGGLVYQIGYLWMTRAQAIQFFMGFDPCIFGRDQYAETFLTVEIKEAGNLWAWIGIGISLWMLWRITKTSALDFEFNIPRLSTRRLLYHVPIVAICLLLVWIPLMELAPAYDEVFSAVHVAHHPPFQAWVYYMYPNNHVLFNVLNSSLFSWAPDQVWTGKFLSVIAYLLLGYTIFRIWLKLTKGQYILSILATLPSLLQLPVWGFASQGRGYEWYLLMMIWMLWIYVQYVVEVKRRPSQAFTWIIFAGYTLLPTFLFMHMAICLVELGRQVRRRRIQWGFWQSQCWAGGLILLFYIPLFQFSGLQALTDNPYVSSEATLSIDFIFESLKTLRWFITYTFSYLGGDNIYFPSLLLFFMPLLLLFQKRNKAVRVWATVWLMGLGMILLFVWGRQVYPFHRNLIGHYALTLFLGIYLLYEGLGHRWKYGGQKVLFGIICLCLSFYFFQKNPSQFSFQLYFYDINSTYDTLSAGLEKLPEGKGGCSDNAFYFQYLLSSRGRDIQFCPQEEWTYYITTEKEGLPQGVKHFSLIHTVDDYRFYVQPLTKEVP